MNRSILIAVLALSAAPAASAQLAQSASYRLDGFDFSGGGGGAASAGNAAFLSLDPLSGAEMSALTTRATLGFLGSWDPAFPSSAPVVFGISPALGTTSGGTPVTVSGMNLGSAPSLYVDVNPASSVVSTSNTLLTAVAPPGTSGEKGILVTTTYGSNALYPAFRYTSKLVPFGTGAPGCAGPHVLSATSLPKIGNADFQLTCTKAPASALGLLLVGLVPEPGGVDPFGLGVPLYLNFSAPGLLAYDCYSDAAGLGSLVLPLPTDPSLVGTSFHAQTIWYWAFACPLGPWSVSSSPGLTVILE